MFWESLPNRRRQPDRPKSGHPAWWLLLLLLLTALPALCDVVINPPPGASQPIEVDGFAEEPAYIASTPLGFQQGSLYQKEPALADSTLQILVGAVRNNALRSELVITTRTRVAGLRALALNEPLFALDLDLRFGTVLTPSRLWVVGGRRVGELQYLVDRGRDGRIDSTASQIDITTAAGGNAGELVVEVSVPLAGKKATAAPASRVDGYVYLPDEVNPGTLAERHILRGDYSLSANGVVTAGNQAVPYKVEIDVDYSNQGNTINLSQRGVLRVVVFSTPQFDATTQLNRGTARLGDPNLAGAVLAARSADHDQNGDGLQDLILYFDIPAMIDGGAIAPSTTKLVLRALTNDPNPSDTLVDVDPLYGYDFVTVTP